MPSEQPSDFKLPRDAFPPGVTVRQRQFLAAFIACGSIQGAADAVGLSRRRHYFWLEKKPAYREAFRQIQEIAADLLISEAYKRALDRKDRASAYLLTFLIKRWRPEYGVSRVEVSQVPREKHLTEAEIDAELSRLLSILGYQKVDAGAGNSSGGGESAA